MLPEFMRAGAYRYLNGASLHTVRSEHLALSIAAQEAEAADDAASLLSHGDGGGDGADDAPRGDGAPPPDDSYSCAAKRCLQNMAASGAGVLATEAVNHKYCVIFVVV